MSVASPRFVAPGQAVLLACLLAAAALTSQRADWQPVALVVVLAAATVVADLAAVEAQQVRISEGLPFQVTMMALLGPAPAVMAGVLANVADARVNRLPLNGTMNNLTLFAALGLAGGLVFSGLEDVTGLDRDDALYAVLVMPVYLLIAAVNLVVVGATPVGHPRRSGRQVLREAGIPTLALELVNGVLAATTVLAWAEGGITAVVFVAIVLAVGLPLAWTVGQALRSGEEVAAMRQVSDERAGEVARLASDRDRLLSEVLQAEERERARLAETLHDGPMQRLAAMRQDAVAAGAPTDPLDQAIAETRAIISAYHPATVREMGFEASLRAAVTPFPAAQVVALTIRTTVDDHELSQSLLLPLARELVVNAVKHADPSRIDVQVAQVDGHVVLEVNDDGVGIDTEQAGRAVQAGHVGLAMVRRRVEDAGGRLEIATRLDGGTRSRVVLPAR